jgi:predicted nucleic acid-binding protein
MKIRAIADSSFLIPLIDGRDHHRKLAVGLKKKMERNEFGLIYLDCVMNEVVSVLGRRFHERGMLDHFSSVFREIRGYFLPERIVWTYLEVKRLYEQIFELILEHKGRLNFHDCLIALLAREKGIGYIVSFDRDFDKIEWIERIGDPSDLG